MNTLALLQNKIARSSNFELVTPQTAAAWMGHNSKNRPLSKSNIARIKQEIETGHFLVNGETITFDWDGNLIDGQHRLMAVIETGKTIEALVVRGLDPAVAATVDVGRTRTAADVLALNGVGYGKTIAGAVRWKRHLQGKINDPRKSGMSNYDVYLEYQKDPSIAEFATDDSDLRPLFAPAVSAVTRYVLTKIDRDECSTFFSDLAGGANLDATDPVLLLRNFLLGHRKETQWFDRVDKVFVAWNHRRQGKQVSSLRASPRNKIGLPIYPKLV